MIEGIYKRKIFDSENGYIVGLIKVTDNDIDPYLNNQTITFTGYFTNINLEDNLRLHGEFIHHYKYGDQFNVSSYELIAPKGENSIISFFSSELFPGIGESKAKAIYDTFGDDAINLIREDKDCLGKVKGLTKKNKDIIYNTLVEYSDSLDIIVKLNEIGFNTKESNLLYHKYKSKVLDMINENIYSLYNETTMFSYKKIDLIALHNNYSLDDKRRIKASIIYIINTINEQMGDTYLSSNEIYNYLLRLISINIDTNLYNKCLNELEDELLIVNDQNHYYVKRMYDAEINIAKRLTYLANKEDQNKKDLDKLIDKYQSKNNIIYDDIQIEAIKNAFIKNVLIITGGPGTGKTTIIKSIINIYKDINKLSSVELMDKAVLLAPTGRASKHLKEVVKMNLECLTIHRFLKWNKDNNKFAINENNKSNYELVIIDEASMIDTYLFDSLLKGLRFNTQIIIVGDYNQLPSVSSGQVLKDLIESDCFKVIKLEKLYRQDDNSNITLFASDINHGEYNKTLFNDADDLKLIKADSQDLIDEFKKVLNNYKKVSYNDFIIMAPMYHGMNGIDNLNNIAREIFNPKDDQEEILIGDTKYRINDKVIELVNMPDYNIYNGDLGIVKEIDTINNTITILFDDNLVTFNKSNNMNFKLGYVISIHKSQGSEFKNVIMLLLNEYGRMLYRKLIYTGVTRAKEKLIIIGMEEAIKKAISNNLSLERKTGLKEAIISHLIA